MIFIKGADGYGKPVAVNAAHIVSIQQNSDGRFSALYAVGSTIKTFILDEDYGEDIDDVLYAFVDDEL